MIKATEILDRIFEHFVTNKAAFGYNKQTSFCAYRADPNNPTIEGGCCLFGLFLTDEEYDPCMEEKNASALGKYLPANWNDNYELEWYQWDLLQGIHDRQAESNVVDYDAFITNLNTFAKEQEIQWTAPDAA